MAVTTDGELKDLQTGATVTYPELFGAAITQPDPLAKAKEDGVEGAIIRLGYGWDNSIDKTAIRNIIAFQDQLGGSIRRQNAVCRFRGQRPWLAVLIRRRHQRHHRQRGSERFLVVAKA
ncbi:hypothetical protein [uncultured Bifidobacterium sp.]|uniref:hypothetical protein n=1 Tax=uncultured Bifidobacterium sp. TaxID=165187 RepID=UPI002583ED55|nr:hypothetical protein [uncultured Bifidobacterium sp.]